MFRSSVRGVHTAVGIGRVMMMKPSLGNISTPYLLAIFGGALSSILGTAVLIGWYSHNVTLIQVSAAFVPMQYNTALGFLLSGLGLLVITGGSRGAGMACGIFVMLIGLLTLAEYILGIDLGIDQLLMKHYITVKTSHPGRMAPNTALCFSLTGAALAVLGTTVKIWKPSMIIGILGSLILGLGIVALAGYAVNLETAYGWGELTRMAVHTAGGFVFLGMAITSLAWHWNISGPSGLPSWFSASVGIGAATIMISLWLALESHEAKLMEIYGPSGDHSFIHDALLVVGIVLAVALYLAAYLAQAARNREKAVEAANRRLATEIDERKMAEEALHESEEHIRQVVETVPDILYTASAQDFSATYISPAIEHLLGFTPEQWLANPESWVKQIHDEDREQVLTTAREAYEKEEDFILKYRMWHKNGKIFRWFEDRASWECDSEGNTVALQGIMTDITARKEAEQKIAKVNRARVAISTCNETLVRATDEVQLLQNICHIVVEQGGYRMAWVGYAEHDEDQTVRPVAWAGHEDGFLNSIIFSWADDDWGASPVGVAICSSETKIVTDINKDWNCTKCRDEAAKRGYASAIALPMREDAAPFGALIIYSGERDDFDDEEKVLLQELADDLAYGVTALRTRDKRLKAEKEVAYLAFHDSLTGLPNRAMLMQSLDFVLAQADRDNRSVAILFIDLDQFKLVNDSLGHEAGDELLCKVAERLSKMLRKSDIVARQGGDEFIIMLPDSGTHEWTERAISPERKFGLEAGMVAQKIITVINKPYQIQGHETYVGASIGISLFPDDAKDVHTLLQHADSAMYYVKEQGRGDYRFYSHELSERQQQRLSMETRLHKAVQAKEFELYYQPIIDLIHGKIVGAEALIRWPQQDGVMLMPDEFLPVAENSGLIISIGHWAAEEACRQLRLWQDKGQEHYLAINLSVRQFWQNDLVTKIMEIVEAAGIRRSLLQLEITESAMMTDPLRMESIMRDFDAHGFKISLDDFGTGYSSLSRLTQLPIHTLKIDKSFVDGVPHSTDAKAIVTTIIELAENLGIDCLAEGVETVEQWHYLRELGCKYGQGYYFSRPVPVSDFNEMLERNQCWQSHQSLP